MLHTGTHICKFLSFSRKRTIHIKIVTRIPTVDLRHLQVKGAEKDYQSNQKFDTAKFRVQWQE